MRVPPPGEQRVYASRRRRLVLVAGLIGIFAATLSLVLEPDPGTGLKPMPGDYLWVVIPGAILVAVLSRRALKSRIVTDPTGVDVVRTVGHEYLPWTDVRHFEVHPTPSREGSAVVVRRTDGLLVKVRSHVIVWPLRNRAGAREAARRQAQDLRDQLEADRRERLTAAGGMGAAGAGAGVGAVGSAGT